MSLCVISTGKHVAPGQMVHARKTLPDLKQKVSNRSNMVGALEERIIDLAIIGHQPLIAGPRRRDSVSAQRGTCVGKQADFRHPDLPRWPAPGLLAPVAIPGAPETAKPGDAGCRPRGRRGPTYATATARAPSAASHHRHADHRALQRRPIWRGG